MSVPEWMNDEKLVLYAMAVYHYKRADLIESNRLHFNGKPVEFYFDTIGEKSGVVVDEKHKQPIIKWVEDQLEEKQ